MEADYGPVFGELLKVDRRRALDAGSPAEVNRDRLRSLSVWFVDACQAALGSGRAEADRCQQLQQHEWELLFDYCYRHASGG